MDSKKTTHRNKERILIGRNGRYRIIKQLHQSQYTCIYLAENDDNGEEVAIKEYKLGISELTPIDEREKLMKAFQEEVDVLSQIEDEAIPKYIDIVGIVDSMSRENPCIVMEYFPGKTLAEIIDEGQNLPESKIIEYLSQCLRVLHKIHTSGTRARVHRDIKPENIVIKNNGRIGFVDFGTVTSDIARSFQTIVGTPGYWAPEQMQGHAIPASDIYSLGRTFYKLIVGKAFTESALLGNTPLDYSKLTNTSDYLKDILRQMTEDDLRFRYDNAIDVAFDLKNRSVTRKRLERPITVDNPKVQGFTKKAVYITLAVLMILGGYIIYNAIIGKGSYHGRWVNGILRVNNPFSADVDRQSNLYVTVGEGRVLKFNSKGRQIASCSGLDNPTDIEYSDDDSVFVLDSGNGQIKKYDENLKLIRVFNEPLNNPRHMTLINYGERILVVESNRILLFTKNGDLVATIDEVIIPDGEMITEKGFWGGTTTQKVSVPLSNITHYYNGMLIIGGEQYFGFDLNEVDDSFTEKSYDQTQKYIYIHKRLAPKSFENNISVYRITDNIIIDKLHGVAYKAFPPSSSIDIRRFNVEDPTAIICDYHSRAYLIVDHGKNKVIKVPYDKFQ